MENSIILASASPRRKELLALTGLSFKIHPSDYDEDLAPGAKPIDAVIQLALGKAKVVAQQYPQSMVIGADTLVALNDEIFGKPTSDTDAFRMLKSLSGKTHQVYTGVALIRDGEYKTFVEYTDVTFYPLTDNEIWDYIATGEPMDKAGAYGIQGKGSLLVKSVSGDYNNVVGLPISRLVREIKEFG